jgi:MFS family permease
MNRLSWVLLIVAESVSAIGSELSSIAIPILAVVLLGATPFQMGLLKAIKSLPHLFLGPLVGPIVDRISKNKFLVFTNIVGCIVILILPLMYMVHILSIESVFIICFITSAAGNADNLALVSFIPQIVEKAELSKANSRFMSILTITTVLGPALAAGLVAKTSASDMIILDAVTFAIAAFIMSFLPSRVKSAVKNNRHAPKLRDQLRQGVSFIIQDSELISVVTAGMIVNCLTSVFGALEVTYLVHDLKVSAYQYAIALTISALAGILGSYLSSRFTKFFKMKDLLLAGVGIIALGLMGIPFLCGTTLSISLEFAVCAGVAVFGALIVNIALVTFTQERTPESMLGSVFGVLSSVLSISVPVGSVIASFSSQKYGVRQTLVVSACALLVTFLAFCIYRIILKLNILQSSDRNLNELPAVE